MLPLRTRLAIAYVGFFAAALIALDFGIYLLVRKALLDSVNGELHTGVRLLQENFDQSNKTIRTVFGNQEGLYIFLYGIGATNLSVQVYERDGDLAGASFNFPSQPIQVDPQAFQKALNGEESLRTVTIEQGRAQELLTPLTFKRDVVGVFQVVRPLKDVDLALRLLFYALLGGGVVVLLATARGGAWLTRAAFKPIDEITHTAQRIVRAEDLSRRVVVPDAQDELQRLTVTINEMLARMEGLFSTQRRFFADVSHELRTPLAAMQGNLEVLDRGAARDPQLLAESLTDMRREVSRMIRMVNDLLLLAQSEAGVQLRHEPVELDTLLLEVHRELRLLANGVLLRLGEEDQAVVYGDRDRIKQALLNLGINALQHTPPGSSVTLNLSSDAGYARLSVVDSGSGIAPEDLPWIFERFYRADRARTRNHGGAGLGLAIVKWIAEAHGGRVTVESSLGQGSTFTLILPLTNEQTVTTALQLVHDDPQTR